MNELRHTVYLIETNYPTRYYVGCSSDFDKRIERHKSGQGAKFTKVYGVKNVSILCQTDSFEEMKRREILYVKLLMKENPTWIVSRGAMHNVAHYRT